LALLIGKKPNYILFSHGKFLEITRRILTEILET
jgi:hypothetical protein